MELKWTANAFIAIDLTPLYILSSSVKYLSPSLTKLFHGLITQTFWKHFLTEACVQSYRVIVQGSSLTQPPNIMKRVATALVEIKVSRSIQQACVVVH